MARMQILTLMMILHLTLSDQGLQCHHDFVETFTCMLNISKLNLQPPITADSNCMLHVYYKTFSGTTTASQRMSVKSSELNVLTASIHIKTGIKLPLILPSAKIWQNVTCDNSMNPVAQTGHNMSKESVVKVSPPVGLKVDGFNVSWSLGSLVKFKSQEFELQFRSAEKSWMDVESTRVTGSHVELQEDSVILHQLYVIRMRAKLSEHKTAIWSDWSTEYSWTSEVGKPRPPPAADDPLELNWSSVVIWISLTGITLALMLILIVLFKYNKSKWLQKIHSSYIPDPSKYFTDLNSHHTGHFASWLGSAFTLDHFITVDTEFVSPVEVVKLQDAPKDPRHVDQHSDALRDGWENTSNFSNSTYFLSQSSNGPVDALEPCSAHCSYGPAGGIGGPGEVLQNEAAHGAEENNETSGLENSLKRLKQLRQDTQSPDSGFAAGAEDSMEEMELPSPLTLNLPSHPLLGLPAPHPNKHILFSWEQTPLVPGPIRMIPDIDLDLMLSGSCGMIEPSSGDYMPV